MKYILVTGGAISGIEKGVIASSIGTMLKSCGHKVTAIKIDPDINVDTGIFAAYKHGEVFVLDDGGEVNLDLGNYERFLDIKLHRDNNITTGKICASVISKERKGDFLGKTVQMISHITNEIQNWVERVSLIPVEKDGLTIPEVCIIELGGKIDDRDSIPFVEAFCKLKSKVKEENFCSVHVSFVPYPKATGEHKTKPTQASVRHIRGLGLSPDLIVCRSEKRMNNKIKIKVSNFCDVPPDQVICVHDVPSVYHVPHFLEEQGLVNFFHERLNMLSGPRPRRFMQKWCNLAQRINHQVKGVCIVLVGKYTFLKDAYASVTEALQHAGLYCNCKVEVNFISAADLEQSSYVAEPLKYHEAWEKLYKSDGVLVPGGFGKRGVEGKIAAIEWARKNNKPFLGSYVQQMD